MQKSSAERISGSPRTRDMITALTSTATCLQQPEHKLWAENKSLIPVSTELLNQWEKAPHGAPPARHDEIDTSVPIHLLRCSLQVNSHVPSLSKQEFSELQHFPDHTARMLLGHAEKVLLQQVRVDELAIVVPFPPFLIASQGTHFFPSSNRIHYALLSLCQHALEEEDWLAISTQPEARQAKIANITSKNTMVARIKLYLLEISSAPKPLGEDKLTHSPGYQRIHSTSQAFATEDEAYKEE